MNKSQAHAIVGGLTQTTKMPCKSYSLPTIACKTGYRMAQVVGSICSSCYANKGNYLKYANNIEPAQHARLVSLSDPLWIDAMVTLIGNDRYFRWHDSGDLQNFQHLLNIVTIADKCPNTQFWIPTKEANLVKQYLDTFGSFPKNLIVRVSATKRDSKPPKFEFTSTVHLANNAIGTECPSYKQGGKCLDCRNCWDKSISNISYKYH